MFADKCYTIIDFILILFLDIEIVNIKLINIYFDCGEVKVVEGARLKL